MTQMWDENVPETVPEESSTREEVDLDALDDGRCKASSWRVRKPAKPTYENHFGPGGFNRCVGSARHVNPLHKDDWGNVFKMNEDGSIRVVRNEGPPTGAPAPAPRETPAPEAAARLGAAPAASASVPTVDESAGPDA